jgi:hypothetical protein
VEQLVTDVGVQASVTDTREETRAHAPPEWSTHPTDVTCPLCGYNLRGLTEPRCPDCGHQFTWRGLLDESSWRHPYLFEHHPRRPIRAFLRTFFASMLPRRFFGLSLRPEHTPRPRMLALFWLALASAILVLPPLAAVGNQLRQEYADYRGYVAQMNAVRARDRAMLARLPADDPAVPRTRARFGSIENYLAAQYPILPFAQFRVVKPRPLMPLATSLLAPAVLLACWPWLSFAALMLFPQSMHEHHVLPVQVFRTVIYSASAIVPIFALAAAIQVVPMFADFLWSVGGTIAAWGMTPLMVTTLLLAFPVLGYRLAIGYRSYLHFRQPAATVFLAQLVVVLLTLVLYHWVIVPLYY